jgi:YidC/Oxa1 family membrane protein insertase
VNPFAALGYIYGFLGPPIEWSLTHLTQRFADVGVLSSIGPFGLAIICVTVVIRGLLFPVFGWQLRTQRRIQAEQRLIAPQLQEIRKKYKKDPHKLNEEMMKLYREHGISPLSSLTGCLPLLFQLPIIYGLYSGIRNAAPTFNGHHVNFLWINDLDKSPSSLGVGSHPGALVLPVLAALATVLQSRMMTQPPRPDMSDQERQAYTLSKNMVFIAPVMVLVFGLQLYQGIALYWLTQNIFMICQQWYIVGWGGLKVPGWFPGAGRTTPLSFNAPPEIA